jgi:NAD+ kinase
MASRTITYFPVFSTTDKAKARHNKLLADTEIKLVHEPEKADYILVWGWDGFMLDAIKKYMSFGKPFFGVNCGTLWFLLNQVTTPNKLPGKKSEITTVSPAIMELLLEDSAGKKHTTACINDIMIWWNILDYYMFWATTPTWKQLIKWSWLIISTSIWSTAYWLNLWWPLIPLHSKVWWVIGIAARPFQYKIMKPQKFTIKIDGRKPTLVWVDGYANSFKNIVKVTCTPSKHRITLGFIKWTDFETKRLYIAEQKLYIS